MNDILRRFKCRPSYVGMLTILLAAILWSVIQAQPPGPARIAGFTAEKSVWERNYESLLTAIPDPAVCRQHSIALTEHPTLVGSEWDWWNVQY